MAHPVFKTGRAWQPHAWKVRFLRRSVGTFPLLISIFARSDERAEFDRRRPLLTAQKGPKLQRTAAQLQRSASKNGSDDADFAGVFPTERRLAART